MRKKHMRLLLAVPLAALVPVGFLTPAWSQMNWHENYFPNVILTTQDGKKVRFYDDLIKGKVVGISFIFTSCTDVCPLDTAKMRQIQKSLGDRVGRDVFLYSITVDPKHDTPAVLKAYRAKFDAQPGWTFLTGSPADITLLQRKLGAAPVTPGTLRDHETRFVFGNEETGLWLKRAAEEQPQVLANLLSGYLQKDGRGQSVGAGYETAAKIDEFSPGQRLFRAHCSSCHTIGGGEGLGPDLAGITHRRSPDWVKGWIKSPDLMMRANNPEVKHLVTRYRGLAMPKLSLSDSDVAALFDLLSESGQTARRDAAEGNRRP